MASDEMRSIGVAPSFDEAPGGVAVLTLDERISANATALGMKVPSSL